MICLLLFCCLSGACLGVEVRQSPPDLITKVGDKVQIFCTHDKTDYRTMLWYQQSPGDTAMKLIGYLNYKAVTMETLYEADFNITGDLTVNTAKNGSLITKATRPEQAVYYCAAKWDYEPAYFGSGTRLTVLEKDSDITPPDVKVFEPSKKECQNKKKTLVCMASNFFPDHVSIFWKIDGENRTDGVATDNTALKQHKDDNIRYTITSRLRVDAKVWFTPGKNFTCIVSFFKNETTTEEKSDSVVGVEAPAGRTITRENYLRVTNAAKLSYGVFIAKSCIYGVFVAFLVWKLQGSTGKQNK